MLRLAEYEATLCACGCGLPIAQAHEDQTFEVDSVKCYARRAIEQVRRNERALAKSEDRTDGWDDGLFYTARPHEAQTGKEA